jgi:hypothetical protein
MPLTHRALGYELRTQRVSHGHGVETVAVFTCRRCPATLSLRMRKDPTANNPEFMAKKARDHGWSAHKNKANRALCPECSKADEHDHEFINTVQMIDLIDVTPHPVEDAATMNANPPATAKITTLASAIASSSSLTPMAKAVAPDSKTRIRALLDKHFDDSRGAYLDGYSDQRIGTELEVPWKAVADLREVAYGPLREDPELAAIKATIETMSVKLGDRIAEFQTWTMAQRKMIDDLRLRVIVIEQRNMEPK